MLQMFDIVRIMRTHPPSHTVDAKQCVNSPGRMKMKEFSHFSRGGPRPGGLMIKAPMWMWGLHVHVHRCFSWWVSAFAGPTDFPAQQRFSFCNCSLFLEKKRKEIATSFLMGPFPCGLNPPPTKKGL